MKVNKICNLDHPVYYAGFLLHIYQNILYSVLSLTWVTPSLKILSQLSQNGCLKDFVYNIIIWLHFLFGFKSNMAEYFCSLDKLQIFLEQLYFILLK